MLDEIKKVIETEINPVLKLHNGSCEVVSLDDDLLYIKLNGGCVGCPSSSLTLFGAIIPILQGHFPDLQVMLDS